MNKNAETIVNVSKVTGFDESKSGFILHVTTDNEHFERNIVTVFLPLTHLNSLTVPQLAELSEMNGWVGLDELPECVRAYTG